MSATFLALGLSASSSPLRWSTRITLPDAEPTSAFSYVEVARSASLYEGQSRRFDLREASAAIFFRGVQFEPATDLVSEMKIRIKPVAAPATAAITMNPSTEPTPWNRKLVTSVLIDAATPIIAPTAP